jgi:hypothetical protein
MTKGEIDEERRKNELQNEEYFRITFIYFVLCMMIMLCFSLGLPKKCRAKII